MGGTLSIVESGRAARVVAAFGALPHGAEEDGDVHHRRVGE